MFAGRLNPDVRVVHHVLFDHDFGTSIDVDTVRSKLPVVIRVLGGGNVVNEVPGNDSITGSVDVAVGSGALIANCVNPNVIIVVDDVIADGEVLHVAVHCHTLA